MTKQELIAALQAEVAALPEGSASMCVIMAKLLLLLAAE